MNHDSNVSSSTHDSTPSTNRWAIILAGGDGTRLRSLTRTIAGDELAAIGNGRGTELTATAATVC